MHSKNRKRYLNLLLIPDSQEATPRSFKISYGAVNFILIGLGIFALSVIFGVVTYSKVLQAALEKDRIEQESLQMREQLKRIGQLQSELGQLKSFNERVRSSLQGYVKFAEEPSQDALNPADLKSMYVRKTSMFSSVPLLIPVTGFVSQEYKWPVHTGIDIAAAEETPIKSAADGVVVFSGWTYDSGYMLIISHPGDYLTFYRHNARNVVSINQSVRQGEVIAFLGNSGETSSGPHLHFEIWQNGQPVDPREYLADLSVGD